MTTDPKLSEVEQAIKKVVAGEICIPSDHDVVIISLLMSAIGPAIRRLLDAKDDEIAALKQPMACGHPRACLEPVTLSGVQIIATSGGLPSAAPSSWHQDESVTVEIPPVCTACSHECLERAAALRTLVTALERIGQVDGTAHMIHQSDCLCERCIARAALDIIPAADQSALDALIAKRVAEARLEEMEWWKQDLGSMAMTRLQMEHCAELERAIPEAPVSECCCGRHHVNYGRCLQCPVHGMNPPIPEAQLAPSLPPK